MSLAVCNPDAFYPLRSFVTGHFTNAEDLPRLERFIRSVVLHDEVRMIMDPWPAPPEEPEWRDEEIAAGGRNVIVAVGPIINEYQELGLVDYLPGGGEPAASEDFARIAAESAGFDHGPYFDAHMRFIGNVVTTVQNGGSIVCENSLANDVVDAASQIPSGFFEALDRGWSELVRCANDGDVGLVVPPFLGIVLNRCARRDAFLNVLADLKREFAEARARLWGLLAAFKAARTLQECQDIERELARAGELMNPQQDWPRLLPIRALWQIGTAAIGGALVGAMAGNALAGAAGGAANQAARAIGGNEVEFRTLFRRGAFDLARRVNQNLRQFPRIPDLLRPILTEEERVALGL